MSDPNIKMAKELFPTIIALTALVVALTSAVVNYRQNDLSNMENALRDTRDQFQLAKSEMAEIRMKTVQRLIDAEDALKERDGLLDEKTRLADALDEANIRIAELEGLVRKLDKGESGSASKARTAKAVPAKTEVVDARPEAADIDIYVKSAAPELAENVSALLANSSFKAKFPEPSTGMSYAGASTVFYYNNQFKGVAAELAKVLSSEGQNVVIRRGSSRFSANKLVVHVIGK